MEWKDAEDFIKKYWYTSNPEMYSKWASHLMMLEASGLLIKNKVVKLELFYELGAFGAIATWEKFKDFIKDTERYMAKIN